MGCLIQLTFPQGRCAKHLREVAAPGTPKAVIVISTLLIDSSFVYIYNSHDSSYYI